MINKTCSYVTKRDLAIHQLEKAIELFHANDFICATTLAGAAEEVLGKIVKHNGGESWLEEHINLCQELTAESEGGKIDSKELVKELNHLRNSLKHYGDKKGQIHDADNDVLVHRGGAAELIKRAINNAIHAEFVLSGRVIEFLDIDLQLVSIETSR